jgi:predicted RND superfamily exporter protein
MQVMSIYIILGVGADNILVFAETWKQSRAQCEDEGADSGERRSGSLESRLEWTWPRATRAVSITSLITVCSFLLTNFTDVPLVSTFGIFVAIALSWNYLLVLCLVVTNSFLPKTNGYDPCNVHQVR